MKLLEGLGSFVEPCYVVYDIDNPGVSRAIAGVRACIPQVPSDDIVKKCTAQRQLRVRLWNDAVQETVGLHCL